MADINDDTKLVRRRAEVTAVVRRRRWSDKEKGRIVAEAIAPGAVAADVARRHDLAPQQLWNWMRAARQGRFALPVDGIPAFVPVLSVEPGQANEPAQEVRSAAIEIMIGAVTVRVPAGAEAGDVEAVLRAVRRSNS
jgi:transposase